MGEIKVAVKGVLIKNNKMLIVKRSAFDETESGTWESVGGSFFRFFNRSYNFTISYLASIKQPP